MEVTLPEMLEAREKRALRQQVLRNTYGKTMVCFTLNIAGPIKNNSLIRRGYTLGKKLLRQQLMAAGICIAYFEEVQEKTGNEAFGGICAVFGVAFPAVVILTIVTSCYNLLRDNFWYSWLHRRMLPSK